MSLINLTFENYLHELYFQFSGPESFSRVSEEKYNIVVRADILKVFMINVRASDIGLYYWIANSFGTYAIMLNITGKLIITCIHLIGVVSCK